MKRAELKEYLDFKVEQYNTLEFIKNDPIQIPHRYSKQQDIEIAGFLSASIAWGKREMIIRNAEKLMDLMDNSPHEYVLNYSRIDRSFVHRTFNSIDLDFFLRALRAVYEQHPTLEALFAPHPLVTGAQGRISSFRERMLATEHQPRSQKHLSDPLRNSAAKRINMFLRWMVRKDNQGVDFGIWNSLPTSELMLPLDVHTGNMARSLGLLNRKQNDWKALEELMTTLRKFDPSDPVKYDFALFGIGINE